MAYKKHVSFSLVCDACEELIDQDPRTQLIAVKYGNTTHWNIWVAETKEFNSEGLLTFHPTCFTGAVFDSLKTHEFGRLYLGMPA